MSSAAVSTPLTLRNKARGFPLIWKNKKAGMGVLAILKAFSHYSQKHSCENKYHPPNKGLGPPTSSSSSLPLSSCHQHRLLRQKLWQKRTTACKGRAKGVEAEGTPASSRELEWGLRQSPLTRGWEKLQIHFFRLDDCESRFEIDGRLHGARSGGTDGTRASLLLFLLFLFLMGISNKGQGTGVSDLLP